MVQGSFGYSGKLNLAFPSGRMKAADYQNRLEPRLVPFAESTCCQSWTFQQDNASIDVGKSSWERFLVNRVHVME